MVNCSQPWTSNFMSLPQQHTLQSLFPIELYPGIFLMREKISEFYSRNPVLSSFQRGIQGDWVEHFESILNSHYQKSVSLHPLDNPIPYLGELFVGKVNQTYEILDGQHRYKAFESFYLSHDEIVDFDIIYKLESFKEVEDMKLRFSNINDKLELSKEIRDTLHKDSRTQIISHLNSKYRSHISDKIKCKYPNVHVDTFVPFILNFLGEDNIISRIETLNKDFANTLRLDDPKRYEQAMKKDGFFLAYLLQKNFTREERYFYSECSSRSIMVNIIWK